MPIPNEYTEAKPYLRSLVAFLIFLRYQAVGKEGSYTVADGFLSTLERDLKDQASLEQL